MRLAASLFIALFVVSACGSDPSSVGPDETSDPNTRVFGKTIKVVYSSPSAGDYHFQVYRSGSPESNGNWVVLDDFTLTPHRLEHETTLVVYKYVFGTYYSHVDVRVDYKSRTVHATGRVYFKDLFGSETTLEAWQWDNHDATIAIVRSSSAGGYEYDETTDLWSNICSSLPCGPWVTFPGYSEGHFDTSATALRIPVPGGSSGQTVIVQLWKGFCPRFADPSTLADTLRNQEKYGEIGDAISAAKKFVTVALGKFDGSPVGSAFPGGYGAEVGIYTPGKGAPEAYWLPYVQPKIKIQFWLVDPINGDTIVHAGEEETWWRTKWMTTHSYRTKYLPTLPKGDPRVNDDLRFVLHYEINGVKGVWANNKWPCGKIGLRD